MNQSDPVSTAQKDRSHRVFPLATRMIEILKTESDPLVCIAAFDCVKVAVEIIRAKNDMKPLTALKAKVVALLEDVKDEVLR